MEAEAAAWAVAVVGAVGVVEVSSAVASGNSGSSTPDGACSAGGPALFGLTTTVALLWRLLLLQTRFVR